MSNGCLIHVTYHRYTQSNTSTYYSWTTLCTRL